MDEQFDILKETLGLSQPHGTGQQDDQPEGTIVIRIATYGVPDKDGDIFEPGSLVPAGNLVAHGKFMHSDGLPVGSGPLTSDGRHVYHHVKFDMQNPEAAEQYRFIRQMGDSAQFSFRARGQQRERYRTAEGHLASRIKEATVYETSPVWLGAGDTKLIMAKSVGSPTTQADDRIGPPMFYTRLWADTQILEEEDR